MFRTITPLLALSLLTYAGSADARTVWKGRDGKAYDSVKDCFTNNPQCLPETAKSIVISPSSAGSPRDAASGLATGRRSASTASERLAAPSPVVCMGTDRWIHAEPCDVTAGELRVQILD